MVVSSFLFMLYTADYMYSQESCQIFKVSDDTALMGQLNQGNCLAYKRVVESFVSWCHANIKNFMLGRLKI